jgi:hypothetical protein
MDCLEDSIAKDACCVDQAIGLQPLGLSLGPAVVVGNAVAQLVEALRYKPEGRGFDSRWCHWIFFIDTILSVAL